LDTIKEMYIANPDHWMLYIREAKTMMKAKQMMSGSTNPEFHDPTGYQTASDEDFEEHRKPEAVEDGDPRKPAAVDTSKDAEDQTEEMEEDYDDIFTRAFTGIAGNKKLIANYIGCQGMVGEQPKPFQLKIGKVRNLEKILKEVERCVSAQGRTKMQFAKWLQVCNVWLYGFVNKAFLE
jgi:hypothetical protein